MNHILVHVGKGPVALGLMQEEYVPLFAPWINAHTSIEGTLLRPPYSLASGVKWVHDLEKKKGVDEIFAILALTKQCIQSHVMTAYKFVGHMGIHGAVWPHGFASTGSVIGSPEAQGKGYGTEAKLLLLYHAFMVMGLRKITSTVKAFNKGSAGHLLKCGYQYTGRMRKHHAHKGGYVDELLFEIFREDWQPIWDKYQTTGELPKLSTAQRELIRTEMTD